MDKLKTIIEQRSLLASMDDNKGIYYKAGFQAGLKYVYDIIKELEDPQCTNIATD